MTPPSLPQLKEASSLVNNLANSAPMVAVLVTLFLAVLWLLRQMMVEWRMLEAGRDTREAERSVQMDARHDKYFEHLGTMTEDFGKISSISTAAIRDMG